ncbi:MAG: cell division protein FtsX [bacterium]
MTFSFFTQFTVSTLIFGFILLFSLILESFAVDARRFFEIQVYLEPSALQPDIERIVSEIQQMPGVVTAKFRSAEEGREWLEKTFRLPIHSFFGGNPLPSSIRVRISEYKNIREIAQKIGQISGVQDVDFPLRAEFLSRLNLILFALRAFIVILVTLLFLSTLFIVFNTIRLSLYARRKEIYVMQLIGATEWFIRFPFLSEAIVVGFLSAVCSLSILMPFFGFLYRFHWKYFPFLPFPDFTVTNYILGVAIFAFVFFAGGAGSLFSIKKFLTEPAV